jgi:hypothetical protein
MRELIKMVTINDFVSKPKADYKPKYDEKGLRIESEEEVENWNKI